MLRENHRIIVQLHRAADIIITAACFVAAYFIKRDLLPKGIGSLTTAPNYYVVLLCIIIIWYISLTGYRVYAPFREHPFSFFVIGLLKACLAGMLALTLVMFIFRIQHVSRLLLGIFFVLNVSSLILFKWMILMLLKHFRRIGYNTRTVLIIGSKERAASLIKAIDAKKAGYVVKGCFDVDPSRIGLSVVNGYKVLGVLDTLQAYLQSHVVDELIFAMPLRKIENADRYIVIAESMGIRVRIIPDWQLHYLSYTPDVASIRVAEFSGVQTLTLQSTPRNEGLLLIKEIMDYGLAFILTLVLAPVFLVIALSICRLPRAGPLPSGAPGTGRAAV